MTNDTNTHEDPGNAVTGVPGGPGTERRVRVSSGMGRTALGIAIPVLNYPQVDGVWPQWVVSVGGGVFVMIAEEDLEFIEGGSDEMERDGATQFVDVCVYPEDWRAILWVAYLRHDINRRDGIRDERLIGGDVYLADIIGAASEYAVSRLLGIEGWDNTIRHEDFGWDLRIRGFRVDVKGRRSGNLTVPARKFRRARADLYVLVRPDDEALINCYHSDCPRHFRVLGWTSGPFFRDNHRIVSDKRGRKHAIYTGMLWPIGELVDRTFGERLRGLHNGT